ncbi:hypothetical protein DACRYDRAFT_110744 [Dacryopinax primogenitus]|uniref:Autophagy-related protein 2 n=1 Tax=Dacryopinax primogenitus (strain DJM 731) TaxID=1858805 RepID=M5FSS5_DACPD|nr:uncharacterized protein DACRYDRAFT_110744 [Dacryopinax primogenitus]EJT98304.1 hypothetical protein DACRYDRAFT_110744 [Dacryopinax primogenitus]
MSSSFWNWYSYIPSIRLPSFNVPAQIQNRLLSFAIRRSIGHLLKRGGVEIDKLDTQVGRGWVEVKDVELEEEAINALIPGLPVRLTSSHLASMSFSLPGILTAPIALSLSGLSLSFTLSSVSSSDAAHQPDLAQSVTEFVGEVMAENEEGRALRRDLEASIIDSATAPTSRPVYSPGTSPGRTEIPGSIDPFMTINEPLDGSASFISADVPEESNEPPAVSILTSILARLVSRFSLKLHDITIRILDPKAGWEWVLTLGEAGYEGVQREAEAEAGGRAYAKDLRIFAQALEEPADIESCHTPLGDSIEPGESMYASAYDSLPESVASVLSISETPPVPPNRVLPLLFLPSVEAQLSTSLLPAATVFARQTSISIDLPVVRSIITPQVISLALSTVSQVSVPSAMSPAVPGRPAEPVSVPGLQAQLNLGACMAYAMPYLGTLSLDSLCNTTFEPPMSHLLLAISTVSAGFSTSLGAAIALSSSPPIAQLSSVGSPAQTRRTSYGSGRNRGARSRQAKRSIDCEIGNVTIGWRCSGDAESYDIISFSETLSDPYPSGKALFPIFSPSPWTPAPRKATSQVIRARHEFAVAAEGAGDAVADTTTVEILPVEVHLDLSLVDQFVPFADVFKTGQPQIPIPVGEVSRRSSKGLPTTGRVKDLLDDLEDDHCEKGPPPTFLLTLSLVRVLLRPAPIPPATELRSGTLVVDLHSLRFVTGEAEPMREIVRWHGKRVERTLVGTVECKRLMVAFHAASDLTAAAFISLTPLLLVSTSPLDQAAPLLPRISVYTSAAKLSVPSASIEVDANIPQIRIQLNKKTLDNLQLYVDDLTHAATKVQALAPTSTATTLAPAEKSGGAAAKILVSEVSIKLLIPREYAEVRPLELTLSDVDVIAELKSGEKHEMVLSVSAVDVGIIETAPTGSLTLLDQTAPRSLSVGARPTLHVQLVSATNAETGLKQNTIKVTGYGFTLSIPPDLAFAHHLGLFFQAPAGAFENAVPTEKAFVAAQLLSASVRILAPNYPGCVALSMGDLNLSTSIVANSPTSSADVSARALHLMLVDNPVTARETSRYRNHRNVPSPGYDFWKREGYASLLEVGELETTIRSGGEDARPQTEVTIVRLIVGIHACADTFGALGDFIADMGTLGKKEPPSPRIYPNTVRAPEPMKRHSKGLLSSIEEDAFRQVPELGSIPDMIKDDLPTNEDYLGTSFPPRRGYKALGPGTEDDDDFDEIESPEQTLANVRILDPEIISQHEGETIRMVHPEALYITEDYYNEARAADLLKPSPELADSRFRLRIRDCDLTFSMHDGYDWAPTRKAIEEEVKAVRRRLAKIRQLLAEGQTPDESVEDAGATLFNSVYIGLPPDADDLDTEGLIAAIDQELNDEAETASQASSWSSFPRSSPRPQPRSSRSKGKRLTRSHGARIQFCASGLSVEFDQMGSRDPLGSRLLIMSRNFEILDHIKTSTWKKFLTDLHTDLRGNVREAGADMVRVELRSVRPKPDEPTEEARLRAKLLPLKLNVDQDALDFIKQFFMFQRPGTVVQPTEAAPQDAFIQHVEVFPVDMKLDYKPKRVDYRALRDGRTIELMNFFHWDGAEITLRHIQLSGITGWAKVGELLNDMWTPDVKAHQLAEVLSGIHPIKSVVNVGSGMADLVLLPIGQYRKDKRIVRGLQKGAGAFMKSTAMEALKVGAQLATGTQVILEQAEHVLGGNFSSPVTAELVDDWSEEESGDERPERPEHISKYADQPADFREGMQAAYKSLSKNMHSAAQTILAVPMEVYERPNDEASSVSFAWASTDHVLQGPVRIVVRAVPIAVLKPFIGATEALSKVALGIRNSMDPSLRLDHEGKYKKRR